MFQILFILFIETFPNNAPYFPHNAPCFPMGKEVIYLDRPHIIFMCIILVSSNFQWHL